MIPSQRLRNLLALSVVAALSIGLGAQAVLGQSGRRSLITPSTGVCEGQTFGGLQVPGSVITSIVAAANPGGDVSTPPGSPPVSGVPPFCELTVTLTHGTSLTNGGPLDEVSVWVWLPLSGWNGRFQGTAGGGNSASLGAASLAAALEAGYSAGATDAGHRIDRVLDSSWVLNSDGSLNHQLILNFAQLSIHEMTVVGKAATTLFYGSDPAYSYFNGCSTGGRQGLAAAQRYPDDYDGILSGAPATYTPQVAMSLLWPQVVQNDAGGLLLPCKLVAFTNAAVAACDGLDGLTDGIISNLAECHFDPGTLVGTQTDCGQITLSDADVIRAATEGAQRSDGTPLWFGLAPGTDLTILTQALFSDFLANIVLADPTFDWHTVTSATFAEYFDLAVKQVSGSYSSSDPDLRPFRDAGGKLVIWHGQADQLIPSAGSVKYYENVRAVLGATKTTNGAKGDQQEDSRAPRGKNLEDFARLFLAPGLGHCAGGVGPAPVDALGSLVDWVEHGKAPDELKGATVDASGNTVRTRPLCMYPKVARYDGRGDSSDAASFRCRPTF